MASFNLVQGGVAKMKFKVAARRGVAPKSGESGAEKEGACVIWVTNELRLFMGKSYHEHAEKRRKLLSLSF